MKKFRGSIIEIAGRGEVLVTRIPKADPLPRKGQIIMANEEQRRVHDVEYFISGEFGRGEMVGIVLTQI